MKNYDKDMFAAMIESWKEENAPEYDDLRIEEPDQDPEYENGAWTAMASDDKCDYLLMDGGDGNIIIQYLGARYHAATAEHSPDEKLISVKIWGGSTLNDWEDYDCPNGETVKSYAAWCIDEESPIWATINSADDRILLNNWHEIDGADYFNADGSRK